MMMVEAAAALIAEGSRPHEESHPHAAKIRGVRRDVVLRHVAGRRRVARTSAHRLASARSRALGRDVAEGDLERHHGPGD